MALTYEQLKAEVAKMKEAEPREAEPDWIEKMGDEIESHPIIHPRLRRGKPTEDEEILWMLDHASRSACGVFGTGDHSDALCARMEAEGLVKFARDEMQPGWQRPVHHYRVTDAGWRYLSAQRVA